jgi:hypothetical protein
MAKGLDTVKLMTKDALPVNWVPGGEYWRQFIRKKPFHFLIELVSVSLRVRT